MLKLIYTENSLHLELVAGNLTDWIERRQALAASVGEHLVVSQSTATFLLPEPLCETTAINVRLEREGVTSVTATRCDVDRVEIGMRGYWLSTEIDSVEGVSISQLPAALEDYLYQLWLDANSRSIVNGRVLGGVDSSGDQR